MRTALIAASCVLAVVTARAEYSPAKEIAVVRAYTRE